MEINLIGFIQSVVKPFIKKKKKKKKNAAILLCDIQHL